MVVAFISGGEIRFDKPFHTRAGKALRSLTSRCAWTVNPRLTVLNSSLPLAVRFCVLFSVFQPWVMCSCMIVSYVCSTATSVCCWLKAYGLRNWVLQFYFSRSSRAIPPGQRPLASSLWLRPPFAFALWFSLLIIAMCDTHYCCFSLEHGIQNVLRNYPCYFHFRVFFLYIFLV